MSSPWGPAVYAIACDETGDCYIGSAYSFYDRWEEHLKQLDVGLHTNQNLQDAWNRHGSESFSFCVLEYAEAEQVRRRESDWIRRCAEWGCAYNRTGKRAVAELPGVVAAVEAARLAYEQFTTNAEMPSVGQRLEPFLELVAFSAERLRMAEKQRAQQIARLEDRLNEIETALRSLSERFGDEG